MSTGKSITGTHSKANSSKSSGKKKKEISTGIGRFAVPSMRNIKLDENIVFEFSLRNDYATLCGALDVSSHPLTKYILEEGLLTKRNKEGKNALDLAASIGNKEFIRSILERVGERLNEPEFDIRVLLGPSVAYNFMHHACIWGRLDVCKVLALFDNSKMIKDPSIENESEVENENPKMAQLCSVLLKTKTINGETPKEIAERYEHFELVNFLVYAEKRQVFLDGIKKIEIFTKTPETEFSDPPSLRKFKDSRKKMDKLLVETNQWLEEIKDLYDINLLTEKMIEIDEFCTPLIGAIFS